MKAAIITMHAARNYGAVLQTHALQKYHEMQGDDSVILDYHLPNQTTKLFSDFQKRCLHLSDRVFFADGAVQGLPEADVYFAGSDQIWNSGANGGFHPAYFLEGINGKKVSYASSIGMDCLTEAQAQEMQGYLRSFSHISVRELSSISILEKLGFHA